MSKKILRLNFPQWQGGNNPNYYFGSRLLSFLAPKTNNQIIEEIKVSEPNEIPLKNEDGIVGKTILKKQLYNAKEVINKHKPNKIITLGGDCLVSLAPFAYLNDIYNGKLGVLWIDAHPDIMTPENFSHAHAMVLGNLLGYGDSDFSSIVSTPLLPENVLYAGLGETLPIETKFINEKKLKFIAPEILNITSKNVIEWIKNKKITKIAIHLDLDVIDPNSFYSLLFNNPNVSPNTYDGITKGKMTIESVQRLINDVDKQVEIVGLGITEFLPWDIIKLSNMLSNLPLLKN